MTNKLAVTSLVLGVLAFVVALPLFLVVPVLSVPAVVVGLFARRNPANRSLALTGIALGAVATLFWVVVCIVFLATYSH